MALSRTDKERLVSELATRLQEHPASVVFAFRSLTVAASAAMRRELRGMDGALTVVKKRLFRRVAERLGLPAEPFECEGSLAVAWSTDLVTPAKVAQRFTKDHEGARLAGGMLNGVFLSAADVERLALLPGMGELRGQLVGVLGGPVRGLVGVLSSTLRGLPAVLQAIAEKRETAPAV